MHKKASNWFVGQFRGFSVMHWILGITLANVVSVTFGAFQTLSDFRLALLVFSSFLAILSGISLWLRRGEAKRKTLLVRMELIQDRLEKTVPQNSNDDSWKAWTDQSEALLRGMGLLRKSQVLKKLVEEAQPENRTFVARNFLRGLTYKKRELP